MGRNRTCWLQSRPDLTVEDLGGSSLGHNYVAMRYRVTSTRELSMAMLKGLRELGCLGYGQEFSAMQVANDGLRVAVKPLRDAFKVAAPTGYDTVKCVVIDENQKILDEIPLDPWSEPYPSKQMPYYVYECESRADSSD